MTPSSEPATPSGQSANGSSDTERLESLVRELQEECSRLRQALAAAEKARDCYRQLFVDSLPPEWKDLDIPTLEARSAGPVEMIE